MTTNKSDPPHLGRKPWLEGTKERHKDPRQPIDDPDSGSLKRTGSGDKGDSAPNGSRESLLDNKEKSPSQKTKSATKGTKVVYKSHSLRSSLLREVEFIHQLATHGRKHIDYDRFAEAMLRTSFLVYLEQKERTTACVKGDLRQTLYRATDSTMSEQPSCRKGDINPPSASLKKPAVDPLESKWKALEESVSKLSTVVLSEDNDSDQEEDVGQEYRPDNVKIAMALLPVFKETCGSVYPLPTVCTSCDGSVMFTWTNRQTLSAVTCSIRIEQKEYEVDLSKYIVHKDAVFQFFPFSVDNQANKESIGKVLSAFLSDVFSA